MANFYPSLTGIRSDKMEHHTEGELALLEELQRLPDDFQVYFQPHINFAHPDIIILHKTGGALIIEVKDWNLSLYSYYPGSEDDDYGYLKVTGEYGRISTPFYQAQKYKDEFFRTLCPELVTESMRLGLRGRNVYGVIKTAVYFHNATANSVAKLFINSGQLSQRDGIKKYKSYTSYWCREDLPSLTSSIRLLMTPHSYFTQVLYDSMRALLVPSDSWMEQMTPFDLGKLDQQQKFLSQCAPGSWTRIKGTAGSGKTLVVAQRAINCYRQKKTPVLILTYNITLRNYIRDRIAQNTRDMSQRERSIAFEILNFDAFLPQVLRKMELRAPHPSMFKELDGKTIRWEDYHKAISDILEQEHSRIIRYGCKYDTVLIDEAQDYERTWFELVEKYFLADQAEFLVVADEKQNLYERQLENKLPIVPGFRGPWRKLSKSYRLSQAVFSLASDFQETFMGGKYDLDLPDSGSFGVRILRPILSSLKYCEHVFLSQGIYDLLQEQDARVFEGKTVFIIGSGEFNTDDYRGVIYLPHLLEVKNVVYYDDKKDSYALFVKHDRLDEQPLDVYFTESVDMPTNAMQLLFSSTAVLAQQYPEVIPVFSMPVFKIRQEKIDELYVECLSHCDSLKAAVQYAAKVSSVSKRLHSVDRKPDITEKYFRKHIQCANAESLMADLQYAYQYYYNMFDSKFYLSLLLNVALHYSGEARIETIEKILNLAEKFCSNKYDKKTYHSLTSKYIEPALTVKDYNALYEKVANTDDMPKTSIFAPYAEFLRFSEAYTTISNMLTNYEWMTSYTKDELLLMLIECSNIKQVCECIDYILELSTSQRTYDCDFFQNNQMWENAKSLKEILSQFILPDRVPAPIYIIDTCAFLHTPDILDYFREDEIIRVPQMVLQELDKHKDNWKNPDLHFAAAKACKSIEEHNTKARLGGMLTFDLESRDYPELLPVGITCANNNRLSPDNLILSCAFRYKAFRPTILTDDTNFRNVSRSQGIEVKAWKEFIEERGGQAERDSKPIRKKDDNSSVQRTNQVEKRPLVKSSAQATDTRNSQSTVPSKQLREEWLKRPVEDLAIADIGISTNVIKGLSAAGITTIKKLVDTTDATIRQKIKALSIRTGAIEAKKKFEQYIEKMQLVEAVIESKEDQATSSTSEAPNEVSESVDSELIAGVFAREVSETVSDVETPGASEQRLGNETPNSDVLAPRILAVPEDVPLTQMGLSIRSFNSLYRAGYKLSGDIIHLSDEQLLKIRNLGIKGVDEVRNWIKRNMKPDSTNLTAADIEETDVGLPKNKAEDLEQPITTSGQIQKRIF